MMPEGETLGVPVVVDGDSLPSPVGIGLTDLLNIGGEGAVAPMASPFPSSLMFILNSRVPLVFRDLDEVRYGCKMICGTFPLLSNRLFPGSFFAETRLVPISTPTSIAIESMNNRFFIDLSFMIG